MFRGKGRTAGMGGSARIFLAVFNFTVDDFFNENQEIKVRSTSSDVGLSHFLFIT